MTDPTTPAALSPAAPVPSVTLATGTLMPQVGLGVFQVPDDEATEAVTTAVAAGYRSIDTASIYGNEAGVGRALAGSGVARADLFVTSKLWVDGMARADVRPAYERSLDLLGLDHLDLFLIHWPAPAQGRFVETWEALVALRADGLVTDIGVSNFEPEHLDAIVAATGVTPVVNQVELHPRFQQRALQAHHAALGVRTQAWSPLGQGTVLDEPVLERIAADRDVTTAQVVLRWHLQHGVVVIPKSVTPSRIASNLDVLGFELSAQDMAAVDALDADGRIGPHPATFSG